MQAQLTACLEEALESSAGSRAFRVVHEGTQQDVWIEATRPFNARLQGPDRPRPLVIVYPESSSEISACMQCAKKARVPVVTRSTRRVSGTFDLVGVTPVAGPSRPYPIVKGGQNVDRPLVIDLASFDAVSYDEEDGTVTVGAGTTLDRLGRVLDERGLMLPGGEDETVSVGEHALTAAFSPTTRTHGLLMDHLVSVQAILADGQEVEVTKDISSDLFWAIRGASHSFAVVPTLTFRPFDAPPLYDYDIVFLPHPATNVPEVLKAALECFLMFQDFGDQEASHEEFSQTFSISPEKSDDGWGLRIHIHGRVTANGALTQAALIRLEAQLSDLGVKNFSRVSGEYQRSSTEHLISDPPSLLESKREIYRHETQANFYKKSLVCTADVTRSTVEALLQHLFKLAEQYNPDGNIDWAVDAPYIGGLVSQLKRHRGTSFAYRGTQIVWQITTRLVDNAVSQGQDVDLVAVANGIAAMIKPVAGTYPSMPDTEHSADEYPKKLWAQNYARLQDIKAKYDPDDVFRFAQSVRLPSKVDIKSEAKPSLPPPSQLHHTDRPPSPSPSSLWLACVLLASILALGLVWWMKRPRQRVKLRDD